MPAGPIPDKTATGTPVPPSEGGTPTPEPQSDAAAAGASNADTGTGLNDEAKTSELRRARDEAAAHRVKLRKYEEAFDGYEDADVDKALTMYRNLLKDPKAARKDFKATIENLEKWAEENDVDLEDEGDAPPAKGKTKAEPKYLTEKELNAALDAREKDRMTNDAVKEIKKTVEGWGYKEGSWQYQSILFLANKDANGDITKAKEQFEKDLKELSPKERATHPPASGKSGGAPGAPAAPPPAEKFDARQSALKRLTEAGF
jgi:putative ubiquitin-RnfH superfamily antitoxin RatB of RatAB toxin-antitoxin module